MICWAMSRSVSLRSTVSETANAARLELTEEQKIRDRQLAAPLESEDLQSLARNELKIKKHTATEGLVWLVRYVEHVSSPSLLHVPAHPVPCQLSQPN
jgi:hypothetical protein